MRKTRPNELVNAAGRLLLALLLVFSQSALAKQDRKGRDKADSPERTLPQQAGEKQPAAVATANAKATGRGSHEGIKVHGHWTIEVRNPDGTVVTHREFENSLAPSGGANLVAVLSRANSVGFWTISLQDLNSFGPCSNTINLKGIDCEIIEPGWAAASGGTLSYQFATLTVSSTGGSTGPSQLVLSGTATASVSDSIVSVLTLLNVCAATVAASNTCANTSRLVFTNFALTNNPVNVTPGQTIAATVTISFS
jgi:hypothetical protein